MLGKFTLLLIVYGGPSIAALLVLLMGVAIARTRAEVLSVRTWLINVSQTGVPLAFGALGAVLGMLPVFWAMGASLLVAGFYSTRRK